MLETASFNRRLRRTEAKAAVAVAIAMAAAGNDGARSERLGDGALVSLGPGRYVNRAIGVGPDLDDAELDTMERFFGEGGLPASAQLSSWASEATLDRLSARGYSPRWFRSVFAATLPLAPAPAPNPGPGGAVEIVTVRDGDVEQWLDVLAAGNEITTPEARAVSDEHGRAAHGAAGSTDLLAIVDGQAVGCGSLQVASGVGWVGGAATLPSHRGRGVQGALLHHRARVAAEAGCDVIAATALPAGASARNLTRHGLRLVDTQMVVTAG